MKKTLLSLSCLALTIIVKAQLIPNKQLHVSTQAGSYSYYRDVVTDAQGNIYAVGYTPANSDLDPGPGVVNSGTVAVDFVSKYNPNTQTLDWLVTYPNTGFVGILNAIDLNSQNEIFVTGTAMTGLDLDPSAGTSTITGSQAAVILKYDNNGAFLNFKQLHNASTFGIDIKIDDNDNIYVGGSASGTVNFDFGATNYSLTTQGWDFFVTKYSSNYSFVWANTFGSPGSDSFKDINQIQLDGYGNTYLTSKVAGVTTIAGTSLTSLCEFVLKINTSGIITDCWKFDITAPYANKDLKLHVFENGKFYIAGGFYGNVDFDPTSGTLTKTAYTPGSANDQFVGLYSSNGVPIWLHTFSNYIGERFYAMTANNDKDVYVWGNYESNSDYDPSSGIFIFPNTSPTPQYMIISYDSLGLVKGGKTFMNGIDPNYLASLQMLPNNSGLLFMGASGSFGTTVDYAPGNPVLNINVTGNSDGIITTYDFCASAFQSTITPSICSGLSYTLPSGTTVNSSGTYTSNIKSYWGCDSIIHTILTVNSLPVISVNSGSICTGQSFTITPFGASTYTISNGNNTIVNPTNNVTYSVTGTNLAGCTSTIAAISSITVNSLPMISAASNNTILCVGQAASLTANGGISYIWSTTETTSVIVVSPSISTTYTVNGTDANGCENTAIVTQSVGLCTEIESFMSNTSFNVHVYPNPVSNELYIELDNSIDNATKIEIFNELGEIVGKDSTISNLHVSNTQNLSSGLYFLKITQASKCTILKFIVNK